MATFPDDVQYCLFYSFAIGMILSVLGTVMLFIGGLGSFAGAFSLVWPTHVALWLTPYPDIIVLYGLGTVVSLIGTGFLIGVRP